MAMIDDCNQVTTEDIGALEFASVALVSNGIKTLHVTTIFSDPSKVVNFFEITYVNPPERRLFSFETLEQAVEKYNQL